mgnify:FL=1
MASESVNAFAGLVASKGEGEKRDGDASREGQAEHKDMGVDLAGSPGDGNRREDRPGAGDEDDAHGQAHGKSSLIARLGLQPAGVWQFLEGPFEYFLHLGENHAEAHEDE